SGAGVLITQDYIPTSGISSLDIGFQYAYQLEINENLTFRPGLQVCFGRRTIDYGKLNFGDQFTDRGGLTKPYSSESNAIKSGDPTAENKVVMPWFPDIAAGGLLFSKNAWFGIAMHHMNTPAQTFTDHKENFLHTKTTLHGGYKFLVGYHSKPRYGVD